jgi:hypothetical protein
VEPRSDRVPPAVVSEFFDEDRFSRVPAEILESVTFSTRIGSVPRWLQSPVEAPSRNDGWRFVAQLDSTYSFLRAPTLAVDWISTDDRNYEGRTHVGQGPNFGDGGIAYVFLRDGDGLPEGNVFWQCL